MDGALVRKLFLMGLVGLTVSVAGCSSQQLGP
jgi:hypothetical protein